MSFADRDTERLAAGHRVRRFAAFEAIARRKLRQHFEDDGLALEYMLGLLQE